MPRRRRAALLVTAALSAAVLSGCGVLSELGGPDEPERDEEGAIVESSESGVMTLRVGDCLDTMESSDVVETVPTKPCSEPHDSEIYASTVLDEGPFPGDERIGEVADEFCYAEFAGFVGLDYESSELDYFPFTPLEDGWERLDDREILCVVFDYEGGVTGSLAGSAR